MLVATVCASLAACMSAGQSAEAVAPAVSAAPVAPAAPAAPAVPVEPGTTVTDSLEAVIAAAVDDAVHRSGKPRESLKVTAAARVTWPDGALGCPEPGMLYTQALVPGYRVVVQAGETEYAYHAGARGQPTFCPPERAVPPAPGQDAT